MTMIQSICVYCGSSSDVNETYIKAASALGSLIAKHQRRLVYGAGSTGLMGAVARATQENGGKVTGVIPRFLMQQEATENTLKKLDELILTDTMHERKRILFEQSDAFVVLPGGVGTLDEIIEMITWAQLDRHKKPMLFVNINGFWNPLFSLLEHMKKEGFLHHSDKISLMVSEDVEGTFPLLFSHKS